MSDRTPFLFADSPEFDPNDFVADVPPGIESSQTLLDALYDKLGLPTYFGFNWNALSDCLRDLHWVRQRRVVLRHADLPALPPNDCKEYLGTLAEAVASWKDDEPHSLTVVFPFAVHGEVTRLLRPPRA